jgi:hypothetical protein
VYGQEEKVGDNTGHAKEWVHFASK